MNEDPRVTKLREELTEAWFQVKQLTWLAAVLFFALLGVLVFR